MNYVNLTIDNEFRDMMMEIIGGRFLTKPEAERHDLPKNQRFDDFNPFGRSRPGCARARLSGLRRLSIEWKKHDDMKTVVQTEVTIPVETELRIEEEVRKARSYSDSVSAAKRKKSIDANNNCERKFSQVLLQIGDDIEESDV